MELPVLDRRALPTVGPTARVDARPPPTGLESAAQGLQDAASVGAQVALDVKQKAEEDAISAASLTFATQRNKWAAELQKRTAEAPLGAAGLAEGLLKDYDAEAQQIIGSLPAGKARQYLEIQLGQTLRGSLMGDAQQFETTARTKKLTVEQSAAIDESRKYLQTNPGAFQDTLDHQLALLDKSGLPADVRESLRLKARDDFAADAVDALVRKDPRGTLAALTKEPGQSGNPAIEALSADNRDRARSAAEVEIRRREAEARAREAEARALAAARSSALKDYMDEAHRSMAMGFGLPEGYADARKAIASLPDDDPRKGVLLRKDAALTSLDSSGFMALPPDKQAEAIVSWEAQLQKDGASPVSLDVLTMARSVQAETARMAAADPVAFAIRRGVVKPPAETGDAKADLQARAALGRQVTAYLGKDSTGFTVPELTRMAERYNAGSTDDRLALVGALAESHGDRASVVFQALDKQQASGMALAGSLALEDVNAARLVARGQKALQENGAALLPEKQDWDLGPILGDAYGLGTRNRLTVENGVKAAYAALSVDAGDTTKVLDEDRLQQAVDAVTGGLTQFNGHTLPLPKRGVSEDDFQSWAGSLQADDFQRVAGISPQRAADQFRENGWLEAVGPNQYRVIVPGLDGSGLYLRGQDGKALTLSFDSGRQRPVSSRASEAFGIDPFGLTLK